MINTVLISPIKTLPVEVCVEPYTGPEGRYLIGDELAFPGMRMRIEREDRVVTGQRAGRWPERELIERCS